MSRLAAGVLALLSISCNGAPQAPEVAVDWLAPGRLVNPLSASVRLRPSDLLAPQNRGFVARTEADADAEALLWAAEHRARIELELLESETRWLTLDARSPNAEPVELTVVWDGATAANMQWQGRDARRIELPASAYAGTHRLDLYVDALRQPRHDPRHVALGIYGVDIEGDSGEEGVWRWMPRDVASRLSIARPADSKPSTVRVLQSTDGERWQTLHTVQLEAGQPLEQVVRLPPTDRALPARVAVVGGGGWTRLLQRSQPAHDLNRRNLVFISLDTTRRDAVGAFRAQDDDPADLGVERSSTPHLDQWAQRARVFDGALSPSPVTAPTHASLFLGKPPAEHGLVNNGQSLPFAEASNVTALLQAWGYEAAGFVSLGVLGSDAGFAQNFVHFDDYMGENWSRRAEGVNTALEHWLSEERAAAPSLVWLHYSDPHFPYGDDDRGGGAILDLGSGRPIQLPGNGSARRFALSAPPGRHRIRLTAPPQAPSFAQNGQRYRVMRLRTSDDRVELLPGDGFTQHDGTHTMLDQAELELRVEDGAPTDFAIEVGLAELLPDLERRRRYASDVRRMDEAIAAAWAQLRDAGWGDDTMVWVFGDHGEDLGMEDGRFGHVQHVRASLSRIPLFVLGEGVAPERVAEPTGIVDVAPSVAVALGLDPLPGWRGEDLLDGVDGQRALHLESFPPESPEHWRALVRDGYKLEGRVASDGVPPSPLRLFDLGSDPNCRVELGLGDATAPTERRMRELVSEWETWTGENGQAPEPDAGMVERLRALGYLD